MQHQTLSKMDPSTDVIRTFTEEMLCLENICMVSIATKLWDTPFCKSVIASCYKKRDIRYSEEKSQAKHYELELRILYSLRQLSLPQRVMTQLEEVISLIGCRFSEHICYVTGTLGLDLSYIDEVYWTSYGTIDRVKIYKSWKKKQSFLDCSTYVNWKGIPLIYFNAAMYVDENFIKENQKSIVESIENSRLEIKIRQDDNVRTIISVLIYLYQFCKIPVKYLGETCVDIPALDMFQVCYKANLLRATEYFWKILNENGNDHVISEIIDVQYNPISGENFYFLINKMSLAERNNFLKKNLIHLSRRLGHDWPFSKLLLMIYDSDLVEPKQYPMLFIHNLIYVTGWRFRFPAKNKLVIKTFTKIWMKLSINEKLNIIKVKQLDSDSEHIDMELLSRVHWYDLMRNFHFQCLKVIINDKDLQAHRPAMDASIIKILLNWLNENQEGLKKINIFMHEVLISNDERKRMENELNLALRKKYGFPSTVNYTDVKGFSITIFD